jgi:hypothetical protein
VRWDLHGNEKNDGDLLTAEEKQALVGQSDFCGEQPAKTPSEPPSWQSVRGNVSRLRQPPGKSK